MWTGCHFIDQQLFISGDEKLNGEHTTIIQTIGNSAGCLPHIVVQFLGKRGGCGRSIKDAVAVFVLRHRKTIDISRYAAAHSPKI